MRLSKRLGHHDSLVHTGGRHADVADHDMRGQRLDRLHQIVEVVGQPNDLELRGAVEDLDERLPDQERILRNDHTDALDVVLSDIAADFIALE